MEYEAEMSFSNAPDRNSVRMRVVEKFSKERAGKGKGELASRYTYYVERLTDGRRVYLCRPAALHNGFDFVVCVEGVNFNFNGRKRCNPKHEDILADLCAKKAENPREYLKLLHLIEEVYKCKNVGFSTGNLLQFRAGYSGDLILAVLKWLFIEQDIRYWNYSGRDMLWKAIQDI